MWCPGSGLVLNCIDSFVLTWEANPGKLHIDRHTPIIHYAYNLKGINSRKCVKLFSCRCATFSGNGFVPASSHVCFCIDKLGILHANQTSMCLDQHQHYRLGWYR